MMLKKILRIFEENKDFLRQAGWEVCEPYSPRWWRGIKTEEELVISAILVQLSKWETVVEALENLRKHGISSLKEILSISIEDLSGKIKPVGLRRIKARRIKALAKTIIEKGGIDALRKLSVNKLREILLSVEGIGEETADAIILFAFHKPSFPASKYVRTVLSRLGVIEGGESYGEIRDIVLKNIGNNIYELKLLYAGLTSVGRTVCKKNPECSKCILKEICEFSARHSRNNSLR